MDAQEVSLRLATVADAARLAVFAERTFVETFGKENTPEDMAAYVRSTFSAELQAREIAEPGSLLLLALHRDAEIVGYAHLMRTSTRDAAELPAAIVGAGTDTVLEVRRFYVAPEWHGSGLAKMLMLESVRLAKQHGARTLWLGVWERNARAIAFYRKRGFREVGSHPFQLGSDLQTDLLMAVALDDAPEPDRIGEPASAAGEQ